MAWCRLATSHYLSQCWHRSMSPNGITRPQWVKTFFYFFKLKHFFPNYCEKPVLTFFPGAFKIALKCPFQSLCFRVKRKKSKDTNFWLKPWRCVLPLITRSAFESVGIFQWLNPETEKCFFLITFFLKHEPFWKYFFSLKLIGRPEIVDFDPNLAFRISRSHGTKKKS